MTTDWIAGCAPACGACGGYLPQDAPALDLVCVCGAAFGAGAPFERARLNREEWEWLWLLLLTRTGAKCEVRSPYCWGAHRTGSVAKLPREKASAHHRRPRGMGGTSRADVNSLAALVLACGDGILGCHGYVEHNRTWARERGLLVPQSADPALMPMILPGGRVVLLDPVNPFYLDPPSGPTWRAA
jgi:hypothetical protein